MTRAYNTATTQQNSGGAVNPFVAGKNRIINGDFSINQRAFTSTTGQGVFTFDRFKTARGGGTITYSAQTFTLGTAPVSGYESTNFLRIDSTGQSASSNYTSILQPIESVKTFAGQTVTISFWAKAASGTPKIGVAPEQRFGSGGSPSADLVTSFGDKTISTSWARYSFTGTIPSISGKTLGTAGDDKLIVAIYTSVGSGLTDYPVGVGLQTATIDIWGVQIEAGSVATAFQTATGTIQGELAACQRYYFKVGGEIANQMTLRQGGYFDANYISFYCPYPVPMRTAPSITAVGNPQVYQSGTAYSGFTWNNTIGGNPSTQNQYIVATKTSHGLTVNLSMVLDCVTTSDYIGVSAEL